MFSFVNKLMFKLSNNVIFSFSFLSKAISCPAFLCFDSISVICSSTLSLSIKMFLFFFIFVFVLSLFSFVALPIFHCLTICFYFSLVLLLIRILLLYICFLHFPIHPLLQLMIVLTYSSYFCFVFPLVLTSLAGFPTLPLLLIWFLSRNAGLFHNAA